ncbi:MAG: hypothetical protein V1763_00085 [Parcubacteria group bacterium]
MPDISLLPNNLRPNEDEQKKSAKASSTTPSFSMHAPEANGQATEVPVVSTTIESAGVSMEAPLENQGSFKVIPKDEATVDLKMKMPNEPMTDDKNSPDFLSIFKRLGGWFKKK